MTESQKGKPANITDSLSNRSLIVTTILVSVRFSFFFFFQINVDKHGSGHYNLNSAEKNVVYFAVI